MKRITIIDSKQSAKQHTLFLEDKTKQITRQFKLNFYPFTGMGVVVTFKQNTGTWKEQQQQQGVFDIVFTIILEVFKK